MQEITNVHIYPGEFSEFTEQHFDVLPEPTLDCMRVSDISDLLSGHSHKPCPDGCGMIVPLTPSDTWKFLAHWIKFAAVKPRFYYARLDPSMSEKVYSGLHTNLVYKGCGGVAVPKLMKRQKARMHAFDLTLDSGYAVDKLHRYVERHYEMLPEATPECLQVEQMDSELVRYIPSICPNGCGEGAPSIKTNGYELDAHWEGYNSLYKSTRIYGAGGVFFTNLKSRGCDDGVDWTETHHSADAQRPTPEAAWAAAHNVRYGPYMYDDYFAEFMAWHFDIIPNPTADCLRLKDIRRLLMADSGGLCSGRCGCRVPIVNTTNQMLDSAWSARPPLWSVHYEAYFKFRTSRIPGMGPSKYTNLIHTGCSDMPRITKPHQPISK